MKLKWLWFVIAWCSIAYAGLPFSVSPHKPLPSLAPMLKGVLPSVVNLMVERDVNVVVGRQRQTSQLAKAGSGVVVDAKQAYILTNRHLILDAKKIIVNFSDGRKFNAKLIGQDALSDLAVLQVKAHDLHAIDFMDSDKLEVGDFVVAIGNPFGLNHTVTSGIVSALQRKKIGKMISQGMEDFIQTDASINPGNSGGALVNLRGELVGVNTAIVTPSQGSVGIGFAIPSNMARHIMLQLIQYGKMQRGILGIVLQDFTPALAQAMAMKEVKGAMIVRVTPHSPADMSHLRVGDVIMVINGRPVNTAERARHQLGLIRAQEAMKLDILRDQQKLRVTVRSAALKQVEAKIREANPFIYGLGLSDFDQKTPFHGLVQGIQVQQIAANTPAWRAGLLRGDVIVAADKRPVRRVRDLQAIAASFKHKHLVLQVYRQQSALFISLEDDDS